MYDIYKYYMYIYMYIYYILHFVSIDIDNKTLTQNTGSLSAALWSANWSNMIKQPKKKQQKLSQSGVKLQTLHTPGRLGPNTSGTFPSIPGIGTGRRGPPMGAPCRVTRLIRSRPGSTPAARAAAWMNWAEKVSWDLGKLAFLLGGPAGTE